MAGPSDHRFRTLAVTRPTAKGSLGSAVERTRSESAFEPMPIPWKMRASRQLFMIGE